MTKLVLTRGVCGACLETDRTRPGFFVGRGYSLRDTSLDAFPDCVLEGGRKANVSIPLCVAGRLGAWLTLSLSVSLKSPEKK